MQALRSESISVDVAIDATVVDGALVKQTSTVKVDLTAADASMFFGQEDEGSDDEMMYDEDEMAVAMPIDIDLTMTQTFDFAAVSQANKTAYSLDFDLSAKIGEGETESAITSTSDVLLKSGEIGCFTFTADTALTMDEVPFFDAGISLVFEVGSASHFSVPQSLLDVVEAAKTAAAE